MYGVTLIDLGIFMGFDQGGVVLGGEVVLFLEGRLEPKSSLRPRVSGRLVMGILTITCFSESVLPLRLLSLLLDPDPDPDPELGLFALPLPLPLLLPPPFPLNTNHPH